MDPDTSNPRSATTRSDDAPANDRTRDAAAYARHQLARRRAKDAFFAGSAYSPLAPEQRRSFVGLAYYPPDLAYRLTGLRLEPVGDDHRPFEIETSDGQARTAYRLGRFLITVDGRDVELTAYRVGAASPDTALFVPFRDLTSGHETYAAGRYLDLEPDRDGSWVIDFNDAYHPYCAYSDSFSCPLPPAENHLPVEIRAGERLAGTAGAAQAADHRPAGPQPGDRDGGP